MNSRHGSMLGGGKGRRVVTLPRRVCGEASEGFAGPQSLRGWTGGQPGRRRGGEDFLHVAGQRVEGGGQLKLNSGAPPQGGARGGEGGGGSQDDRPSQPSQAAKAGCRWGPHQDGGAARTTPRLDGGAAEEQRESRSTPR